MLSSHYALFHALGLLADLIRFAIFPRYLLHGKLELCYKQTTFGSLPLLTLYSFHFADEDVSAAISTFLNSDSPTAKVKQSFQKQSNKATAGPLLLLCCDKDDLQPGHLCLRAAAQVIFYRWIGATTAILVKLGFLVDFQLKSRSIYLWFCLASTVLVGFKTIVNLRCLLFSLALPGFCGRSINMNLNVRPLVLVKL